MRYCSVLVSLILATACAQAQQQTMPGMQMNPVDPNMQGMQMASEDPLMQQMHPRTFLQQILHHAASGTSTEPNSTPAPMLMSMHGPWMLMFHANAFVTDIQQTDLPQTSVQAFVPPVETSRGGDKFFSTNWFMPMAERELGPGQLTLRAMFSLEPATITARRYPLLFQQGETAFGRPIVDGQHPHDFFMEIAALYDWKLGSRALLSFYAAPIGDPAIGPTAYPHRASAMENPVAALGHHQEDSTHIADEVVTAGVTYQWDHGEGNQMGARIEASGFHGREPDENRWNIDAGAIDSWSTRLTLQPAQNWSGQFSYARIASPEALFPAENQARTTASVMYNRPFRNGNLAATALWGRTRALDAHSLAENDKENSYLLEATVGFLNKNHTFTRIENAGRSNELLNGENPLPPDFTEQAIGHVQAYTFGYDHEIMLLPHISSALGAQVTTYGVPDILQPIYGSDPVGVAVFLRLRPRAKDDR